MSETEKPALSDPGTFPDDRVLSAILGPARDAFEAALGRVEARCPGAEFGWKYYRDGKSWLMKASWKKKTLFWLSAGRSFFRTTFYLPASLEGTVLSGSLPPETKEGFSASAGKKTRGATVTIAGTEGIAHFDTLLSLKLAAPGRQAGTRLDGFVV
jgi:hypothetical protein